MNANERHPFGDRLWRVFYVIVMGWPRWGKDARHKWAREMRSACIATVQQIDAWEHRERMMAMDVTSTERPAVKCGAPLSGRGWARCNNYTRNRGGRCWVHT